MELTQEEKEFIETYILTVSFKLKKRFNLSNEEADKMIRDSVFYEMIQEDPEYIVNHNTDYWVYDIYKGRRLI